MISKSLNRRRLFVVAMLSAIVLCAGPMLAHENFRVVGTVVGIKANKLQVKTTQGRTITMTTTAKTKVTRNDKPVKIEELKPGLNLVVNGRGDTIDALTVLDIRIVPALTRD